MVPQCLDNQFVSERVFRHMTKNNADFSDKTVHDLREAETKTELIRSLVYASQVIINRAYMLNNENVFKYWSRLNPTELAASARLVSNRALVPYLFNETSLDMGVDFDVRAPGAEAIKDLLQEVDSIACVRLAADENANRQGTRRLAQKFRTYLMQLRQYDDEQRNILGAELFSDRGVLSDADNWQLFSGKVDELAKFAFNFDGPVLRRAEIYKHYVSAEGTDSSTGQFRADDRNNPFVYELKKLVDLAYNTTLPDLLQRYTFTPTTLPTRAALQDDAILNLDATADDWQKLIPTPELLDYIRRQFMAQMGQGMTLPLLSNLSMADVIEVRRFDEWESFRAAQTEILRNPLGVLDLLPRYSEAFDRFQGELSRWYAEKYKDAQTQERYANIVTFMLKLGGRTLCATMIPEHHEMVHVAADSLLDQVIEALPKRVKGVVAKLMIGVYNTGRHQLDRERSYTIELMHSNQEIYRDEIGDLINRLTDEKKDIPVTLGIPADQGKE